MLQPTHTHSLPSGKRLHNYGTSQFFMGNFEKNLIFHSYVSLPEGVYVLVMVSSSYFLDNYLPASFLLGYASKESYVDKEFFNMGFSP